MDKMEERALRELRLFTDWLAANSVKGFIGEYGFPKERRKRDEEICCPTPGDFRDDYLKWNHLAETWFRAADEAKLWAAAWATGEWWQDYSLAVYTKSSDDVPAVDVANTQHPVVEGHPSTPDYERGITVAGAEFAANSGTEEMLANFSNRRPGLYGEAYQYPSAATFDYLDARGISLVRIPFRWERIQPRLGGRLDAEELRRLKATVAAARRSRPNLPGGMKVILDVHNFGAYYEARSAEGPGLRRDFRERNFARHLVDLWARLSGEFKSMPGVYYGLMCEPVDPETEDDGGRTAMTEAWEQAGQQVVDKLREAGDANPIIISGYLWSGVINWATQHPRRWINDRENKILYEAHHYWDSDSSGHYCLGYEDELRLLG